MRTALLAMALVLGACGRSERARTPAASSPPQTAAVASGPDQLVLRFPRRGGPARAFAYPRVDSLVWTSTDAMPALERILGFDDEAGSVSAVDVKGTLTRLDLHLGVVSRAPKLKLTHLSTSDGSTVFGIGADGSITRVTPTDEWSFKPPAPARDVVPEPDGSVLILADEKGRTVIWQMHPPARRITDTATVPRVTRAIRTQVGDRVYFTVDSGLIGLRSRGLEPVPSIRLGHRVRALAPTPSGDRLYIAEDSSRDLIEIDRYTHKINATISLPGQATELRMDPTGRFVLARPASGDSAWVIDVGTDALRGTVATEWRGDLPAVGPNGWLALLKGHDVALVDGDSLAVRETVKRGGDDLWLFISWDGFRPRTLALGGPAPASSTAVPAESVKDTSNIFAIPAARSDTLVAPKRDTIAAPAAPESTMAASTGPVFTVQFAALRSEPAAHALADSIVVDGTHPRVVVTTRLGVPIWRVLFGPYPSRDKAEHMGKSAGRAYWVYQGAP